MGLSRLATVILDELVHAGTVTSNRLHEIGGKSATRRISELRGAGYDIQRDVQTGAYRLPVNPLPQTTYATYRCPCGFVGAETQVIHTLFGLVCPKCGKALAA